MSDQLDTTPKLLLWDIDLTLVDLRGLGGTWYAEALTAVAGIALTELPSFPGRTERAITVELLTAHGVEPTEELINKVWAELVTQSAKSFPTLTEHGHALPGAAAALDAFAGKNGVVQSLVTGNLPEVARHKLDAFALGTHIDFDIGGYGTISAHRADLVSHAVEQASGKHGAPFAPESVVIIGDTPHDVAAALDHGALAVGVATGRNSAGELRESGAHLVFENLSDTQAVLKAILNAEV